MLNITSPQQCCGCSACAAVCPKDCIRMEADDLCLLYPRVNSSACTQCGLCSQVCPVTNHTNPLRDQTAYAAIHKDDDVRRESSSGGVFSLLADDILAQGGVVFGAAVTNGCRVCHIAVEDPRDLIRLRGSKYVQSDPGDTFRQVRQLLRQDRPVLYAGTPCQIQGLRNFLRQDHPKLTCIDVVCHGAPAPGVWQHYVAYRERLAGAPVREVSFRDKRAGWLGYQVRFSFENGKVYQVPYGQDPYMRAFLSDLSLRPSCYRCSCKGLARPGDFTLADFWGVQKLLPQMFDDKGTSLVFVNTPKAKALWDKLSPNLRSSQADIPSAVAQNPAMVKSVAMPKQRELFLRSYAHADFTQAVHRACPPDSPVKKLIKKAKRLIKRLVS